MTALGAFVDSLSPGGAAYVDRDWFNAAAPPAIASAIIFDPDAGMRWAGGLIYRTGVQGPDTVAWQMIDRLAASVAVTVIDRGPTLVPGRGLLAARLRARLGQRTNHQDPPAVVVETTGQSAGLAAACSAVADLGIVVLAATPLRETLAYGLYPEIHRRGLQVVGVPDPDEHSANEDAPPIAAPTDLVAPVPLESWEQLASSTSPWFVVRV